MQQTESKQFRESLRRDQKPNLHLNKLKQKKFDQKRKSGKEKKRWKSKVLKQKENKRRGEQTHVYSSTLWLDHEKSLPWKSSQQQKFYNFLEEERRKGYCDDYGSSCFVGNAVVTLHNGIQRSVHDVKAGDVLQSGASVVCVTRQQFSGDLYNVDGLLITGLHPVRVSVMVGERTHKWIFPRDGKYPKQYFNGDVYNFLLDNPSGSFRVNGVEVAGFQNDKSPFPHKFYTTDLARRFLEAHPQFPHVRLTDEDDKKIQKLSA